MKNRLDKKEADGQVISASWLCIVRVLQADCCQPCMSAEHKAC